MTTPPPTTTSARPTYRAGPTINQRPQLYNRQTPAESTPKPAISFEGPVITVFVGNISERAPEAMIKKILAAVGTMISWKRVSTFGFCEYEYVKFRFFVYFHSENFIIFNVSFSLHSMQCSVVQLPV